MCHTVHCFLGKTDIVDKIAKLQKSTTRTISYSRPVEHTEPLFKTSNLLKFNDKYCFTILCPFQPFMLKHF